MNPKRSSPLGYGKYNKMVYGIYCCFFAAFIGIFGLAHEINGRCVTQNEHATAVIEQSWYAGRYHDLFADIVFERKEGEKIIPCRLQSVPIGLWSDTFKSGDKLDIVPRPDSCFEPVILNQHNEQLSSLATFISAATLGLLGASFAIYGYFSATRSP